MHLNKNTVRTRVFLKLKSLCLVTLPFCFPSLPIYAGTSLTASGHVGVVGQTSFSTPPMNAFYSALRVPVGLTIQANPTDHLSLYLGLEYAYNNYPGPSVLLGQTVATSQGPVASSSPGTASPLPFSNATNGTTPYSQKTDLPVLTQVYFAYETDFGVLRAGRMPHNWGLGIWNNTNWTPYTSLPTTTDAVSFFSDFNAFDVNLYYEKFGEGVGGTSRDAAAVGYTVEARLKGDPADASSAGISRELGVAFTKFSHPQSSTNLNILDFYEKIYISQFYVGSEFLYPTGSTQSPNYQALGGAAACTAGNSQTCSGQNISALAALLKLKYQFNASTFGSLAATEKAQKNLGTAEREVSHTAGIWVGYASGGSNQFSTSSTLGYNNNISAIMMNSGIQPAFLMFNNTMPSVNGMPGGALTNTTFFRLNYAFESPKFGTIEPIFTMGWLNRINENYNATVCANPASPPNKNVNPNSAVNILCVGGNKNLGAELDLAYRYTTMDRVTLALEAGYWFVGKAWQEYGQDSPQGSLGTRASISTEF